MKKLAKRNLICFAILAVLLMVLCFVNFTVPATTSRFVGFVPAITKDIDINGGLASKYDITYDESVIDTDTELQNTVKMLSNKLAMFGYGGASVSVGANNNIYVEMPAIKQASGILNAIATVGPLYITTASQTEIDKTTAISGQDVVDVASQFSQINASAFSWGVNIKLTTEGQEKLKKLTEGATSGTTLNIFVGEDTISQIGISSQLNTPDLYFYGTESTQDLANVTALQILMGKYSAEFDMVNNEIISIAPAISPMVQTLILIALAVVLAAVVALFFVKFGQLGFLVLMNLVFLLTISAFFMQAIPVFVLSYSGIIGLLLGVGLFFVSNYIIFNSAKKGYAEGKKLPLAIKLGLTGNTLKIVDISVVAIIFAVAVYLIGGVYAQSFAFALALASAINMLVSLVFNKLFTKWYTKINTKKAHLVRFTREEHVNELD